MVSIVVQGCDSFDKNLNQRTFVYIRYTDERYEKALKGVEIYFYHQFPCQEDIKSFRTMGVIKENRTLYVCLRVSFSLVLSRYRPRITRETNNQVS